MKTNFKHLAALAMALTVTFASCSKEDTNGDNVGGNGTANVQLKVYTESASTRAAGTNTQGTVGSEATLATNLFVAVYDDAGVLETQEYLTHTAGTSNPNYEGVRETTEFTVKTGDKYFYVISDPANILGLGSFTAPTSMSTFQSQIIAATQAAIDAGTTSAADGTNFINATLWPKKETVTSTTTTLANEIGRIVGKVYMVPFSNNNDLPSDMAGTFSTPSYRVGSAAVDTRWVGQFAGLTAPPAAGHGQVTSASHNHSYTLNAGATPAPAAGTEKYFTQAAFQIPATTVFHYVNENTTAPISSALHYGNTTHIQFMAVYTPDPLELYKGTDGTAGGTLAGDGSFWTGYVGGALVLFDTDPTGNSVCDNDLDIKGYKEGYNLYKFPIRDRNETTTATQCRILRNHYYEVTINKINHLGEPVGTPTNPPIVEPPTPIDDEVEIELTINVLKWSKISQGENL